MKRIIRECTKKSKQMVESEDEDDGESESSNATQQQVQTARRQSRSLSFGSVPRFRMKKDDDEEFVKLCVEHFEQINNTKTLKGIFLQKKQVELNKTWETIAAKCNVVMNVSKNLLS